MIFKRVNHLIGSRRFIFFLTVYLPILLGIGMVFPLFNALFIEVYAKIRGPKSIPVIVWFFDSGEPVYGTAMGQMIRFREDAVDDLLETLNDDTKPAITRGRCAVCLAKIGSRRREIVISLREASEDQQEYVRAESFRALWELNREPAEVSAGLIELLNSKNEKVLHIVRQTLDEIGPRALKAVP